MTDDDIRAHVMKAEGVLDEIQDKVTGQFGEARKAIMAIDRAYSQLLDSRDFYREARNELITDRDHWEAQAKEARAQGVSDLISRHRLENQVRNREAERDELKAERDDLQRRFEFLQNDFNQFYLEHRDGTPHIITAEELRKGQTVAIQVEGHWMVRRVTHVKASSVVCAEGYTFARDIPETIVLLADAPVKDVSTSEEPAKNEADSLHVTAEDIRNSEPGSTWDTGGGSIVKFDGEHFRRHAWDGKLSDVEHDIEEVLSHWKLTRSTAAPRGTYPKRLTVEDLDAAGVGSQLEIKSTVFIKTAKGGWSTYNDGVMGYPSEYMIRNGWGAATLTYPEEITPDPEPTPRLTIHALNTASAGSVVSKANRHWTKTINGAWFRVTRFGQAEKRTSEELLAAGYANATLTYPERGDHE